MHQPVDPTGVEAHQSDYNPQAWHAYTLAELGMWVHLLATRAGHRKSADKHNKDLEDAQNYLDMMQAKLNALKS
jgi:hypothetical protein